MVCRCWLGDGSFISKYHTHADTETHIVTWKLVKSAHIHIFFLSPCPHEGVGQDL